MTRHYSATAVATTLGADITDSATSITVAATTGFPAVDFILALDFGEAAQELVLVTNVSGTTLTVTRGYDSTTAAAHSAGAAVRHVHSAIDFRDSRTHEAASSGVHGTSGSVVGTTDTQALSNKDLSSGTNTFPTTLATTNGSQTLTNKTIALGSNTVSGTKAQFNSALTDGDFASQAGTETLTNKTIALGSNTVSGTTAQFNSANTDGDFATLAGTETLTNKTVNLSSNTLAGTTAQFNSALSDNDFATLAGSETLTNKTLTSPTISGIGAFTYVEKSADESVASSTTLQDDNHLTFAVPAAGTYLVDLYLLATSADDAAGDIKIAFSFPTGTLNFFGHGLTTGLTTLSVGDVVATATLSATSGTSPTLMAYGLSLTPTGIWVHAKLTATATGDLKLQWAQVASDTNNSTLRAGSHMTVRRVA